MAGAQGPESSFVDSAPFSSLAELSQRLSSTRKRLELVGLLADFLRGLPPHDIARAVLILLGKPTGLQAGATRVMQSSIRKLARGEASEAQAASGSPVRRGSEESTETEITK
jgi:hypothetical protein